jgi:hypothetical protein
MNVGGQKWALDDDVVEIGGIYMLACSSMR